MLKGFAKEHPSVQKKKSVEVDAPKLLCEYGMNPFAEVKDASVSNLTWVVFEYLLRVGEYTHVNQMGPRDTQTQQCRVKDVMFLQYSNQTNGRILHHLPRRASFAMHKRADACTLSLSNQKNSYQNAYIHHEANGGMQLCLVKALAR
jgi:hypothetical protein